MSKRVDWASARFVKIESTARPNVIERNGDMNSVPAINLIYGSDGQALVIEGRPDHLRMMAETILSHVEFIETILVHEPELRALYGMPPVPTVAELSREFDGLGPWHDAQPDEVDEAIADYERGEYLIAPEYDVTMDYEPVFDPKED
jgi:hypothetical protein